MRIRGISFSNPLGQSNIPLQIEQARLLQLLPKIKNGTITKEEYDEIARGFIRLGVALAAKYAAKWVNRQDDFVSAAMFGIVKALSTATKLQDDNLAGYIAATIHSLCKKVRHKFRMIGMSQRTWKRYQDQGKEVKEYNRVRFDGNNNFKYDGYEDVDIDLNPIGRYLYKKEMKVSKSSSSVRDIKEILYLACKDEIDHQIVEMRAEGYTDLEIAEQLKCSNSYINNRRSALEKRYERLNADILT